MEDAGWMTFLHTGNSTSDSMHRRKLLFLQDTKCLFTESSPRKQQRHQEDIIFSAVLPGVEWMVRMKEIEKLQNGRGGE